MVLQITNRYVNNSLLPISDLSEEVLNLIAATTAKKYVAIVDEEEVQAARNKMIIMPFVASEGQVEESLDQARKSRNLYANLLRSNMAFTRWSNGFLSTSKIVHHFAPDLHRGGLGD